MTQQWTEHEVLIRLKALLTKTWASYHNRNKHRTMYSACRDPVCVEEMTLNPVRLEETQ